MWFNGQPVAVVQADGVYYVHADHLATPRSIVKASNGAEIWRWDSEPFGAASPTNPNPASGGLLYNVRFPGQYLDVESGVFYNGMRDYQPATGRYLQADPIGLRGGLARYGYALANPLSYLDPSGMGPEILMPYADRGTTYGSPYAFERYDRGPSSWSQLNPGTKLIILTGVGAAMGGVAGGVWGARAGIAEASAEGSIAAIGLIPEGVWGGVMVGTTSGGALGSVAGSYFLVTEQAVSPALTPRDFLAPQMCHK